MKETDRQNFIYINSEHPISLKNIITYSQISKLRRTCSTIENFTYYCPELKQKFIENSTYQQLKKIRPKGNVKVKS